MSAVAHLRLIDGNGELVEPDDPQATIKALEAALVRADKTIKGLRAQLNANREKAKKAHPIDEAYEDWKAKLVAAGRKGMAQAKLSDDRIDSMARMFEAGYTLEQFKLAATGIAHFQFMVYGKRRQTGSDDARELCIGKVCEKARWFEECARLGAIVEKARKDEEWL